MSTYIYKARDKEGKIVSGTVDASNKISASSVISDRGWVPTSIVEKSKSQGVLGFLINIRGIPASSRSIFTRQLATMVSAGLPLTQSLELLFKQENNSRMREIIQELYHDVESGNSLSQGLSKYPEVFSRVYVNLVKAGESSGSLDKVLTRLAENEEKLREFLGRVRGAFIYPIIVLNVMAFVFIIMMVMVVPRLVVMYKDLGSDLPLPTKILIWISDLFTKRFYIPLVLGVLALALYRYLSQSENGKKQISKFLFKLPIVGNLRKESELTEFCRTLSLLVSSGIPILDSLSIVSDAISDPVYRESLKRASKEVERGVSLSTPLKADSNFPSILSQMVAVGEETGKLDEVLLKVSYFFESETESALKSLTVALEPAIMIVLGVLVALLVISIVMPIYKLTSQI